jgi:outer membrane protein OmpA-like peptidoglycan-associated protein
MARSTRVAKPVVILALMTSLCAGGCAVAPPIKMSRTTVVLMPDEDGNVGAVSVTTDMGSQKIDEAYSFATVEGAHSQPSDVSLMGRESVTEAYSGLLKAQPPKPKSFILHFLLDKTILTEESKALLPAVLEAIRERKPTEITIFGHADATGSEKHNIKLSAERAKVIANWLRKDDPTLDRIDVQFFGDKEPLIPTDSRIPEPRNRRAEVMIL